MLIKFLTMSFTRTLILIFVLSNTPFLSCTNGAGNQPKISPASDMPAEAGAAQVNITELNCWVEQGHFFIAGICDNLSPEWQKIWLKMTPMDSEGKPLKVNGEAASVFRPFSDAVAPRGRTSFFAGWPLDQFSGTPDSCVISGAGAVVVNAGPILVVTEQSGVKMLLHEQVGDSLVGTEKAWQLSILVENPLELQAAHPRIEMLVYGTDKRLWYVSVLNPEDPAQQQYLKPEREGPMAPREKRRFAAFLSYENLPQALKEKKIWRIDYQAFNAQQ